MRGEDLGIPILNPLEGHLVRTKLKICIAPASYIAGRQALIIGLMYADDKMCFLFGTAGDKGCVVRVAKRVFWCAADGGVFFFYHILA